MWKIMRFYISASRRKRVAVSRSASADPRRFWRRRSAVLAVVLLLGVVLAFLFFRAALLVLESPALAEYCVGLSFFRGSHNSLNLGEELTRALLEAEEGNSNEESSLGSFNELVNEVTSNRHDIKAFAFKTKAMVLQMERRVRLAKQQESINWYLASQGVPFSLNCFCLKLAEEHAENAVFRARLPSPEHVFRLNDPSFHHVVLLTDNVLAASVVVFSTVQNSANPEKLVFHIVTDKKTYPAMHAWFASNSIKPAVVEVKGLHQFYWSEEVNMGVKEMMEIHQLTWDHHHKYLGDTLLEDNEEHRANLEALRPSCLSLMNHLRIYIPELFPDLKKIVFLDDDIIVQRDISSLWKLNLDGKIVGAVVDPERKYKDYLNFSHPVISSNFDNSSRCPWLYGVNVFDLEGWRRNNITASYHHWLQLNLESGYELWHPGALPPALVTFEGHVHHIDPSWHVAGLGHRKPDVPEQVMHSAAVIHFSGLAKPWLAIGSKEARSLWYRYVDPSNEFIRKCAVNLE